MDEESQSAAQQNSTPLGVLHSVDSYLRTTENWIYRQIKHQRHIRRYVASDRFLECNFDLSEVHFLRSPLQPMLVKASQFIRFRRMARALTRISYQIFLWLSLRREKIDIVHSHFAHVGWLYRKLARRLHAKHVVSFYGWDYAHMAEVDPAWYPRLKEMYTKADCFVCEGLYGANQLTRNGCPASKIRVVKLGVEPDQIPFFVREKRVASLRLLQIATFREKKGHVDTVRAFADALVNCPNMHLTLVGASPGEIHDEVVRIIHARAMAEKVSLLPGVQFEKLHHIMGEHHVFIHPSRHALDGDCEGGAPIVLLDAQATGMPVISTLHCDIPQEVVDEVTGILCAEGDIAALAAAIGKFYLTNNWQYAEYSQAARRHVERNFDARDCATAMEALYGELAATRGRA